MKRRAFKELVKRYLLFVVSLFFSALGVAFTKKGGLGVSPVSSIANVLSIQYEAITIGNALILCNCALILGQILILRRKFAPVQLMQIPLSFLFGFFTDFAMKLLKWVEPTQYMQRIALVVAGTFILGFGVFLSIIADVVLNSAEGFVKAIADVGKREFSKVKVAFDISCVAIAIVLSLLFFSYEIVGTREGTLIVALFTGVTVGLYNKTIKIPVMKFLRIEN